MSTLELEKKERENQPDLAHCEKILPRLRWHINTVPRDCDEVKRITSLPSKA